MKLATITAIALAALTTAAPTQDALEKRATVKGFDISHWQGTVDFAAAYKGGLRLVYIKATEGETNIDDDYSSHHSGARKAGFITGAYHFAHGGSSAVKQADHFLAHGGDWSKDGKTLPGMLDLEGDCTSVSWIKEFSDRYHSKTGRYPVLYSSPAWWKDCTKDSKAFAKTNQLMMACWNDKPCDPQGGWSKYTIWQKEKKNQYGGDSDVFNGSMDQLKKFASG